MSDRATSRPAAPDGPVGPGIRLRRLGYRLAFLVLQVWWALRRPDTRGVKLIIRDGDDVLFVRHSYGTREAWELPGGGRSRNESPAQTATREVREELGLELGGWRELGVFVSRKHATAHLTCLTTEYDGRPIALALHEVVEARWAPAVAPPRPLGEHAQAALELAAGFVSRDRDIL